MAISLQVQRSVQLVLSAIGLERKFPFPFVVVFLACSMISVVCRNSAKDKFIDEQSLTPKAAFARASWHASCLLDAKTLLKGGLFFRGWNKKIYQEKMEYGRLLGKEEEEIGEEEIYDHLREFH
ncbi:MAG: hypothetical protein WAN11_20445 [Syntrophobacteraceae bacterium]